MCVSASGDTRRGVNGYHAHLWTPPLLGGFGVGGGGGVGVAPLGAREILGERRGSRAKSAIWVAKMGKHNMGQK